MAVALCGDEGQPNAKGEFQEDTVQVSSSVDALALALVALSWPHTSRSDLGAQYKAGPTGATHSSLTPPFKRSFFLKRRVDDKLSSPGLTLGKNGGR